MAGMRPARSGFTLIELLVVIALIGILMALLLPAVQQAREAARRTQCRNNLRQLALACHNYHDAHQVMPLNSRDIPGVQVNGFSWITMALPYLDQRPLYDQLNFNVPLYDTASSSNGFLVQTPLPVLLCAVDPTFPVRNDISANWAWPAMQTHGPWNTGGPAAVTCYKGFGGTDLESDTPTAMFVRSPTRPIRLADILDGSSNVLMLGEHSPSYAPWCAWSSTNGAWVLTSVPINKVKSLYPIPDASENPPVNKVRYGAVSMHVGGVFAAFCDGSVHWLSENMDYPTYEQLGCPNDGLPVGGAGEISN